jgi:hypothetical protein
MEQDYKSFQQFWEEKEGKSEENGGIIWKLPMAALFYNCLTISHSLIISMRGNSRPIRTL